MQVCNSIPEFESMKFNESTRIITHPQDPYRISMLKTSTLVRYHDVRVLHSQLQHDHGGLLGSARFVIFRYAASHGSCQVLSGPVRSCPWLVSIGIPKPATPGYATCDLAPGVRHQSVYWILHGPANLSCRGEAVAVDIFHHF